jgi:phenylalanyl-tRNA synthetase beta chain
MKVSLSWLNEYVPVQLTTDQLANRLTMLGLEVETVEDRYDYLEQAIVCRITAITPHPNADKLKLCQVECGGRTCQVVCGAPNATPGMVAALALPGCQLPSGVAVAESVIRGQKSQGMLCSAAELGLGEDSSGLMVLDDRLSSGLSIKTALNLTDPVLDISLTPNRSDCLSILGIAREVAGFQGVRIQRPAIELPSAHGCIDELSSVTILAPTHCPRYAARLVEDIQIGPSPFWLRDRLISIGLRPINNIVDITNFILMETGQPLHAFDFDHLAEQRIVVRTAGAGEQFTTLDGKQRSLTDEMLMICDGQKPVAIGGVMGGLNSEIETSTTRVLIESAYFSPASIRKTAKQLGLATDASHRFERGVDPQGLLYALDRAAQLMAQLGRGRLVGGTIDVQYNPPVPPRIDLSVSATNRLLGTRLSGTQMAGLLEAIAFEVQIADENTLRIQAPSFRVDVTRPQDLMEEVARCSGYDDIPVSFPAIPPVIQTTGHPRAHRQRIRTLLVGMGFSETINYSFVHKDSCRRLRLDENDPRSRQLSILNPLTEDQSVMRTSLIPGLLETMQRNVAHHSKNLKLFETGKIFISRGSDRQPQEIEMLAGLWTGDRIAGGWYAKPVACDFFDLKGGVEALLAGLGIDAVRFTALPDDACRYTCPGASAQFHRNGERLGTIGEVHPKVLSAYDLKQKAFIFEIELEHLTRFVPDTICSRPLPKYPPVQRDATLTVAHDLESDSLVQAVEQMHDPLVEEVRLVDVFIGQPVVPGFKSVTLRMVYRSQEATLEDSAVNRIHAGIVQRLVEAFPPNSTT